MPGHRGSGIWGGRLCQAGNDFEAIENLRRLAFADQVEAPQQLSLWQADAGQTETGK